MSSSKITQLLKETKISPNPFGVIKDESIPNKLAIPNLNDKPEKLFLINKKRNRGKEIFNVSGLEMNKKANGETPKKDNHNNSMSSSNYSQTSIKTFFTTATINLIKEHNPAPPQISQKTFDIIKNISASSRTKVKKNDPKIVSFKNNFLKEDSKSYYSLRFKYEEFLNMDKRELCLPLKYKILLQKFRELEHIINLIEEKDDNNFSFQNIEKEYLQIYKKKINKNYIEKIIEIDDNNLYKISRITKENYIIEKKTNDKTIREKYFKYKLIQIVFRNHILFLINKTLENPITFDPIVYKTWHHDFPLNEIENFISEKKQYLMNSLPTKIHEIFSLLNKNSILLDELVKWVKEDSEKEQDIDELKIEIVLICKDCPFWLKLINNKSLFDNGKNDQLSKRIIIEEEKNKFDLDKIVYAIKQREFAV